ncbi:MAG TPA: ABC transporter substrate-binding protein [Vicinamibacteria bacterium]|nr:ABC transporter substrate-binding protein [Vicinamibacteria bacterium]
MTIPIGAPSTAGPGGLDESAPDPPGPVSALLALAFLATPVDTLVIGILADPPSLAPHRASDFVSAAVVVNVCETLVRLHPGGSRPEPALATTWASLDRRAWTFTLRKGVRFHDGTLLDADAVVANLENLRLKRGFPGRAERVGPYVVSITLDRPSAALLATLSQPFFSLQSPRQLAAGDDAPVGTGPYRLGAVRPGLLELLANADYWGGAPRLKRLVFRRLADEEDLAAALLAGDVDVTSALGQDRLATLHRHPEITLDSQTGLNLAFLSINNEHPPFGDRRVRQALARAVDRRALVNRLLGGHGEPAQNPLPPSLFGYGTRTKELILDRPAARRLLAEAGFPAGFETTLMAVNSPRPYMPAPLRLAAEIREDLLQVGIRARLREVPTWSEYVERGSRGDYDLAILGWQADTADPNDFLSALLASEAIGTTNRSRYRSPDMDALLKRGRMGGDPEARLSVYHEAQELFQRDMPWVPLYHVSVFTAYRRVVRGLTVGPTGILRFDKTWKRD